MQSVSQVNGIGCIGYKWQFNDFISGDANDKVDLGADGAGSLVHLRQRQQLLKQLR